MTLGFLSISGGEIILILIFVLVFFGADRIPDIARGMGRALRQVKDATQDIQRDIQDAARDAQERVERSLDQPSDDDLPQAPK